MRKAIDETFELSDDLGRGATCRVRVFVPKAGEAMNDAVVLVGWSPSVPDFPTGPWLEPIVSGFRDGLADIRTDRDFLLVEWYQPRRYEMGPVEIDFDEEIGLVLFRDLQPDGDSPAANLRSGRREAEASRNASMARERRSLYWTPLCREAVEMVVGESLDAPATKTANPKTSSA